MSQWTKCEERMPTNPDEAYLVYCLHPVGHWIEMAWFNDLTNSFESWDDKAGISQAHSWMLCPAPPQI